MLHDAERILSRMERDPRAPDDVGIHTGRVRAALARWFDSAGTNVDDYHALVTDVARLSFAYREPMRPLR